MAFSSIQLVSNALILLGDQPINSFDEPGAGAKAGSNLYESTYLAMLSSHRWKFATKKVKLSRLTATPLNEYKYQFQLPTDYVLITTTYPRTDYKLLEDKLYSDYQEIEIDYIYKVPEDRFPSFFVKAFEYYLATQLAIPVTEDFNKMELMYKMYGIESAKARYSDAQSAPQVPIQDMPYIQARQL